MMSTLLQAFARALPPEEAHRLAIKALANGLLPSQPELEDPRLAVTLGTLSLPNPVGLAAGFDKNAQTLNAIFRQGFGFVECGTVTPLAQPGNPKPRVFRLPQHQAVINRLGFNNDGLEAFVARLKARPSNGIVGANIGKNKDSEDALADYVTGAKAVYADADYLTINISSPNTQGLRDLQQEEPLRALIRAVDAVRQQQPVRKPIWVKIAPDLDDTQLEMIADLARAEPVDALIVSNTTIARPPALEAKWQQEAGGLSGVPLMQASTEKLRRLYQLTEGTVPLIGVGGIASAEDAYEKICAGASAIQLYTALAYQGFALVTRIKQGLLERLERDGLTSIGELVGRDVGS